MGLVAEIQRDALNASVAVSTLLRKVKVAASKLDLGKVEDWVEAELGTYTTTDLPTYRILYGRPEAFNPYRGWIPIVTPDAEFNDMLARCEIRQSLSSLEDTIKRSETGTVHMPYQAEQVAMLNELLSVSMGKMAITLSLGQVQGVVDAVRNMVLDWALALEKQGIVGNGMTFDKAERTLAKESSMTINIGSVGNFAGNLGHGNTARDITAHQNDSLVFSELSAALSRAVSDAEERQGLMERIAEMEAAKSDRGAFAGAYGRFMSAAANHMAIVAPFIPALSAFLSG